MSGQEEKLTLVLLSRNWVRTTVLNGTGRAASGFVRSSFIVHLWTLIPFQSIIEKISWKLEGGAEVGGGQVEEVGF
jgi:hypothetical protein